MSATTRSRDDCGRPLCEYPLSSNHCLWKWSKIGRDRTCYRLGGVGSFYDSNNHMWSHVPEENRRDVVRSEKRAYYDIITYDSILRHANVTVDPTTGHMLQTIQMI